MAFVCDRDYSKGPCSMCSKMIYTDLTHVDLKNSAKNETIDDPSHIAVEGK